MSIDCWKRLANTGPSSVANSSRTMGYSSSGPKAFEGFSPLRSFRKSDTVKPVLSGHSKIDKTKVLKANGSLMKVESYF